MRATQDIIDWINGDAELRIGAQEFQPGNDYEYGVTELRDWIEALLYAPGIYTYRPDGLARTAALASVRRAVTGEDFNQIDWGVVLKAVRLDSP